MGGAAGRRAERGARTAGSGASTAAAANGELVGAATFLVEREVVFLAGAALAVADSVGSPGSAALAGSADFAERVVFFAGLRLVVFLAAGASVVGALASGAGVVLSAAVVFFVVRLRVAFLAGAGASDVVSVVGVGCSLSSMDGAPVVPRAPGSAPHGTVSSPPEEVFRRKACG
jgi:hypothetical protein